MNRILTACVLLVTFYLSRLEAASNVLPNGDVWLLKDRKTGTFQEVEKFCLNQEDLVGDVVELGDGDYKDLLIQFLKENHSPSVWLNALKHFDGSYIWKPSNRPVNTTKTPFDETYKCDSNCCNVMMREANGKLALFPCEAKDTAKVLCKFFPSSYAQKIVELTAAKVTELTNKRKVLESLLDNNADGITKQEQSIKKIKSSKTTFIVLYCILFVTLIGIGAWNYLMWQKIN
jgi:hypothetical protein